jgi:hypothetical protein
MLNLNLNIVGAGGRSNIGAGPDVGPTTTTTTTTTTTSTTTTTLGPVSFRNDPYSASLLFATPGNEFTTLGMALSYSDVHADVAGVGTNFTVNTGSFADSAYTNFAANGYVTSTRVQSSGSFYNQNNSAFQFTTQDITFETWVYGLGDGSSKTFYSDYLPGDVLNSSLFLSKLNNNTLRWVFIASTPPGEYVLQSDALAWDANQWYHIAFVKNGTDYIIYRDGVNVAQVAGPDNINSTNQRKRILGFLNAAEQSVWVQDYKIYKGAAVYTSSFTPPPSMVT